MPSDIEKSLVKQTYGEIAKALRSLTDDDLLSLLDSKSIKVGDSAASELSSGGKENSVLEFLLGDRLKTKNGKLRGLYILQQCGQSLANADTAYLHMLIDKNVDVVSSALFGLVFLQNKKHLKAMKAAMEKHRGKKNILGLFEKAERALREKNPFLYSPNFSDEGDVWKVHEKK